MVKVRVVVQSEDFNIADEINSLCKSRTDLGALTIFTGLVRDTHDNINIKKMTLEHFPNMALKELNKIGIIAKKRWQIEELTIIHRYGELFPGDQIVLVITASHHREDSFKAAQFIMDMLKTDAPFWKKEELDDGSRWVISNKSDKDKKNRWI